MGVHGPRNFANEDRFFEALNFESRQVRRERVHVRLFPRFVIFQVRLHDLRLDFRIRHWIL